MDLQDLASTQPRLVLEQLGQVADLPATDAVAEWRTQDGVATAAGSRHTKAASRRSSCLRRWARGTQRLAWLDAHRQVDEACGRVPRLSGRTYTRRVNPNPPYLATIVIAVLLMVVGLSLEGSLFSIAALNQMLGDALAVVGVKATQELARILIIASPTLLIIGSLVRGI
jgi:hypothetical protein